MMPRLSSRPGLPEPAESLVGDCRADREHRARVDDGGEDLGTAEAVGVESRRRALGQPSGERAEQQRGAVGQHVAGIGNKRERAGPPAA
jgi:hypothetical protein